MDKQIQLLIFSLDDRHYALHLSRVKRVVRAVDSTPLPQAPEVVFGVIDFHGQLLPLLNIRRRFGFPEREIGINDQFVIVTASGRTVALVVDSVKEIVERPAAEIVAAKQILGGLEQIEGAIQLEDGLILIHDLDRFLSLNEQHVLSEALTAEPAHG